MTTKLTARRFRIRRPEIPDIPPGSDDMLFDTGADDGFGAAPFPGSAAAERTARPGDAALPAASDAPSDAPPEAEIDAVRREGLTGRQLRLARRIAQKHGLPATSDHDAVRLLRRAGIDPFQRTNMLELVAMEQEGRALAAPAGDGVALPAMAQPPRPPAPPSSDSHIAEVQQIQRDLARRRRRRSVMLTLRLFFFVLLPTILTGGYYYLIATPLYATRSEFVIQQSQNPSAPGGGLGGLLQGSPLATSQDSIAVQGYLQSREAMLRLDADHGFRDHFSQPHIDAIQRLAPDATSEQAYRLYSRNVQISYDPTEGIVKMEVVATDPATSASFSQALISYAEGQVDQLTQRLREDQMRGARESYEEAERKMLEAQRKVVQLQEQFKVLSSEVEVTLITAQITQLETQLLQDRLSLQQMQSNATPNLARMEPLQRRITTLEAEIAALRGKLTEDDGSGLSLAQVQSELLVAQADVQTRQLMLAQAIQAMESARVEANRQVRYLSLSVSPTAPDEAAYPRAFENTLVALLIFTGIYLMLSMTVAILREQVSA
jgi:capsular polysaccharide transport system permease protein